MLSTILTKSFSKDTALLILRVITGTVLIHHGFEKLANIENFADAFVRPLHLPFPIFLSYVAAFSEIGGSWLLILGLATRFGALAIVGTISVAIYHALVTSGFNIFLLELLLLYFASATSIALTGPGDFSIDEVIIRVLRSESDDEDIQETIKTKTKTVKSISQEESTNKGGIFQFLQANLLSDTSN
ncbi:DoxX family protein [Prochlorococcus sp. AH-716-F13]|nr:DoxX family protein [Prochlorococcus sp. AH-716-F13]